MWSKISLLILLIILICGAILRTYKFGNIPAFHVDEVDFGNNAYSILKTGKDQNGDFLPIGTTSLGDMRPAGYMYLAVLPIKFLGLNETAVRLPTIVFSILSILILYLFARDLFGKNNTALITAGFLAFSFWHINLSREASEKIVSLFFVLTGIWQLYRFILKKRFLNLFISFVLLLVSIFIYYSPRLFLLLFLPTFWFLFIDRLSRRVKIYLILFIGLFSILTLFFTFYKGSNERINQLLIFNNPYTEAILGEQIREEGYTANVYITRFFHNKLINYSFTFLQNYLEYFSPKYFFVKGGEPIRVSVPGVGLLNLIHLPFLLIGSYLILQQIQKRKYKYLLLFLWLFLAPVPASLTFDEIPNVYRTVLMLPPLMMISAYGANRVLVLVKAKKILFFRAVFVCIIYLWLWHNLFFLHQYFVHAQVHKPWYRNYAQKELALWINNYKQKYTKIYITKTYTGIGQLLRFYQKYSPEKFQMEGSPGDDDYKGFGKYIFVPEECPYPELVRRSNKENLLSLNEGESYLFINSGICEKESIKTETKIIRWKDGQPAYRIIPLENYVKK